MLSRTMNVTDGLRSNMIDRRLFLTRLAAFGGAVVSASGLDFVRAAESPGRVTGDASPAATGRGKVLKIRSEIKEYKDPKTGARVRQLTGDGSSNVHPYFTSWAFVGNDADKTIIISNRSGSYQWYMLEIPTGR